MTLLTRAQTSFIDSPHFKALLDQGCTHVRVREFTSCTQYRGFTPSQRGVAVAPSDMLDTDRWYRFNNGQLELSSSPLTGEWRLTLMEYDPLSD